MTTFERCGHERPGAGVRITRRAVLRWPAALFVGAVLVSCAPPPDPNAPPTITYGQDVCDRCGMIISDSAYAGAYWTAAGEARRFDDLGELVVDRRERGETTPVFVHDYETRAWLRGEGAHYVTGPALRTPMGAGVVAVAAEAKARALAERTGGEGLTFAELNERLKRPGAGHTPGR